MTHQNDGTLPDELRAIGDKLRTQRPEASAMELDRIKLRAMSNAARPRASAGPGRRSLGISRAVTIILVVGLLGGGAAIGATGGGSSSGSAANTAYKPGCGPKKNDGQAGNSGTHTGQPPKDQNRGDCPD